MVFLQIKETLLNHVKQGKISNHTTISKGKKYHRGKIYLPTSKDNGMDYQLFAINELHLVEKNKHRKKGKGYLIYISNDPFD